MADLLSFILSAPKAVDVAKKIAELLKLVASVDDKLDMLAGAHFDAGMRGLRSAANSESAEERINQLRFARENFNIAVGLEKSYRLALTWLGLACCHNWLGDKKNSEAALRNILHIDPLKHMSAVHVVRGQVLEELELPIIGNATPKQIVSGVFLLGWVLMVSMAGKSPLDIRIGICVVTLCIAGGVAWRVTSRWATSSKRSTAYKDGLRRALADGDDIGKLVQVQNLVAAHLNEVIPWVQVMGEKQATS